MFKEFDITHRFLIYRLHYCLGPHLDKQLKIVCIQSHQPHVINKVGTEMCFKSRVRLLILTCI